MAKKIVFHCSPPAYTNIPSPPLSILKGFLNVHGYESEIIYWNIAFGEMQKKFLFTHQSLSVHPNPLLLFLNYIAIEKNDNVLFQSIKTTLISSSPEFLNNPSKSLEDHMLFYKKEVDKVFEANINKFDCSNALYFGFSLKFEQWLFASILATKLKKQFSQIPIIIGGIANDEAAVGFLRSFSVFDIAMWGEGEISLLKLTKQLGKTGNDLEAIPNIAYRKNGKVVCSEFRSREFVNLSDLELVPDYSDYIDQVKDIISIIRDYVITIEFSRGCHWNKCHFCYLNLGYKYRRKSDEKIKREILHYIENYSIYKFAITDNDIIGSDINSFNELLDILIEIRKVYPRFVIVVAEVVTKGLNKLVIKKMVEAGFFGIQIGYENTSDRLLSKIEKINSFSSNILFLKYSHQYRISVTGLNVIYNLLEETTEDICEAVYNLKFLRFYRSYFNVKHKIIPLTINSTSKYYKKKQIDKKMWKPINTTAPFIEKYWDETDSWHILDFSKLSRDPLWHCFEDVDNYYLENRFSYSLRKKEGKIIFTEYINNREIYSFDFDNDSLYYRILYLSNDEVVSFDYLKQKFEDFSDISTQDIVFYIKDLHERNLLFHNEDLSEIISIINMDLLI